MLETSAGPALRGGESLSIRRTAVLCYHAPKPQSGVPQAVRRVAWKFRPLVCCQVQLTSGGYTITMLRVIARLARPSIAAASLALVLASGLASAEQQLEIHMRNNSYQPEALTVPAGTTVR